MQPLTKLEELDISGNQINGGGLQHLKSLPHLKTLILYDNHNVDAKLKFSDESLDQLREMPALTSIVWVGQPMTDATVQRLIALTRLETFEFGSEQMRNSLPLVGRLKQLKSLSLRDTQDVVIDEDLKHLQNLVNLKSLKLDTGTINGSGFRYLQNLTQLTSLDLCDTQITDENMIRVCQYPQLESLNLGYAPITDAGLESLVPLSRLESLDLSDTKISAGSIAILSRLKSLKTLDLQYSQLTDQEIAQLQAALPNCKIQK